MAALARPGAHLARCRRLASGWENEIGDELLRQDLLLATDGQPERRLATAGELADRLRRLGQRHADMAEQRRAQDAARRDHEALARAQVRRPITYALIGVLVLGIAVALWLRQDGWDNVLQLDDGILGYFEQVGGAGYAGGCFVFDARVALDPQLQPLQDAQA